MIGVHFNWATMALQIHFKVLQRQYQGQRLFLDRAVVTLKIS